MAVGREAFANGFWAALTGIAVSVLIVSAVNKGREPRDASGPLHAWYRAMADGLPPDGRVGFLRTGADFDESTKQYFIAQAVLAPRVLVEDLHGVEFVVTGTNAGRLDGFEVVRRGEAGIAVLRRAPVR